MEEWEMCPRFEEAMSLLGKRWTGLILEVLMNGAVRFTEMAGAIPELSDRMLAERLKELEAAGLVSREVFPETPVRIVYSLTEKGRAFKPVLDALHRWADQWVSPHMAASRSDL